MKFEKVSFNSLDVGCKSPNFQAIKVSTFFITKNILFFTCGHLPWLKNVPLSYNVDVCKPKNVIKTLLHTVVYLIQVSKDTCLCLADCNFGFHDEN